MVIIRCQLKVNYKHKHFANLQRQKGNLFLHIPETDKTSFPFFLPKANRSPSMLMFTPFRSDLW